MAATDTWMPLYIGDYAADTGHLGMAEHGAYLLLIMHYWRTGPLPDDDKALARIARADRKEWQAVSATVRQFFSTSEGRLHHKRIDRELATAVQHIDQRRAAGKASAAKRALQRGADENPTGVENSLPISLPRNAIPSPSPSPVADKNQQQRARADANGAGPPRWDDAAIVPEPTDHRPTVNGWYLDWTFDAALDAANIDPVRTAVTWKPVIAWLKANIEPEVIVGVIRRCAERDGYAPPSSLAYFDKPVRQGRVSA